MKKININLKYDSKNLISELKKEPLLSDYNITINNFGMFNLYLKEQKNCQNCKGLDQCMNETIGLSSRINLDDGEYHLEKFYCQYMKDKQRKEKEASRFKTLYLPKSITEANFDDFRLDTPDRKKAYQYIISFANSFSRNNKNKGLYVCGNFQIGKTYFLACAANYLASKNIESLLIYLPDLIRELKNVINKPEFEEKINLIKSIDVLMLDDIGAELVSPWVRDEILCPVINYRLQEGLPVFFSSNYTINGLMDRYKSIDGSDNASRRLIERIKVVATFIDFKVENK